MGKGGGRGGGSLAAGAHWELLAASMTSACPLSASVPPPRGARRCRRARRSSERNSPNAPLPVLIRSRRRHFGCVSRHVSWQVTDALAFARRRRLLFSKSSSQRQVFLLFIPRRKGNKRINTPGRRWRLTGGKPSGEFDMARYFVFFLGGELGCA